MCPKIGIYTKADADADIAAHAAVLDAHHYPFMLELRTGNYFLPLPVHASEHPDLVADTIYALPFPVARALTIDRLAIRVKTVDAGKIARLGIYKTGANLYPGALVKDYGTVSVAATDVVAASADQALTKGLYFLVVVSNGAPELYAMKYTFSPMGQTGASFATGGRYSSWEKAGVGSGALADPFVAGATLATMFWGVIVLPRLKSLD